MIIEEITPQQAKKAPTNLVELAQEYRTSSWFTRLRPATKQYYENYMLPLLNSPYGLKPLDTITPRIADVIYNQICKQNGVASGQKFVAVWHRVFEFADKYEYVDRNPWRKVEAVAPPPRKVAWTEEQVFKVIEHCLQNGNKELAVLVCILYDSGQRPSDIMYLQYKNIKQDNLGYYIDITQSKRGAMVKPALSKYTIGLLGGPEVIAQQPPEKLVVERIKNIDQARYEFACVREALGFENIQLRDLRRTVLTEMGEASDDLMISVSGHSDRDMLNIYSLRNRHKALEAQRIRHATRNSRLNQEFTSPARAEETV